MNSHTNKEKGNSGLGMAIAYFSTNGFTVSIPLNDTQDYDSIIEKEGILNTVQVKSTGCKTKYGMYLIPNKEIKNESTLNLCDKYKKYEIGIE